MRLECNSCGRSVTEKVNRALLGRVCLKCQKGKLVEPETAFRAKSPDDHPDPWTTCKPPAYRGGPLKAPRYIFGMGHGHRAEDLYP